jgi:4-hydroxy-tetrahydrodipicolinate synthase
MPFQRGSEEVDYGALEPLVDFAVSFGATGVCIPAYASEFYKLTEAERTQAMAATVRYAAGRVAVVAQSNHPSAKVAAEIARQNADLGADVIAFALPRLFGMATDDLLYYAQTICRAIDLPVLIQDFNPNGATVDAAFCRRLRENCPNFAYIKLEEPLMGAKVEAIRAATADAVGVLEGWGGLYLLELMESGICGIMPGLGPADILAQVWKLGQEGLADEAMTLFERVMPQLVFGLQNLELFLHTEKQLLQMRGLLADPTVRHATFTPNAQLSSYGEFLNRRIVEVAQGLPQIR